jgi:hypothetical protein
VRPHRFDQIASATWTHTVRFAVSRRGSTLTASWAVGLCGPQHRAMGRVPLPGREEVASGPECCIDHRLDRAVDLLPHGRGDGWA